MVAWSLPVPSEREMLEGHVNVIISHCSSSSCSIVIHIIIPMFWRDCSYRSFCGSVVRSTLSKSFSGPDPNHLTGLLIALALSIQIRVKFPLAKLPVTLITTFRTVTDTNVSTGYQLILAYRKESGVAGAPRVGLGKWTSNDVHQEIARARVYSLYIALEIRTEVCLNRNTQSYPHTVRPPGVPETRYKDCTVFAEWSCFTDFLDQPHQVLW